MGDARGNPAWARSELGPIFERAGFRPGKKNARRAEFVRALTDGGTMTVEFLPGMVPDDQFAGSFEVQVRVDDERDQYYTSIADILSLADRKQFIEITNQVLRRIPRPPADALAYLATTTSFYWHKENDLSMWRDFLERAWPPALERADSGSRRGVLLLPGPGPDCEAGRFDRDALETFARGVREATDATSG